MRRSHIPRPIIECIANNRDPSPDELLAVAERICGELGVPSQAFGKAELREADAKLISMRAAYAAFTGSRQDASN